MRVSTLCPVLVVIATGCTAQQPRGAGDDLGVDPYAIYDSVKDAHGHGSDGGMVCDTVANPGDTIAQFDFGLGGFFGPAQNLALGTQGQLIFALNAFRVEPPGSSVLVDAATGAQIAAFAFGRVVAADDQGHLYIAGTFDGIRLSVLEIDSAGRIVQQFQLDCGHIVQSIAVARDGRIAISGPDIGTVIVDHTGKTILLDVELVGDVAFDSKGNLVIGGGELLTKLDRDGNVLLSDTFPGGTINAVAIGPHDEIGLAGNFFRTVDLFGTIYVAQFNPEARVSGVFAAVIDAGGRVLYQNGDFLLIEFNDLAFDPAGHFVISGAKFSSAFNRQSAVLELDISGRIVFARSEFPLPGSGDAHGLAIDRCGNVFVSIDAGRLFADRTQFIVELAH